MKPTNLVINTKSVSAIGLGCSRLGSFGGASIKEAEYLIQTAIDRGITFYDTASSYGQGDSERLLGRLLGKQDQLLLVTKIGKIVPFKAKALQPVKAIIRKFTRRYDLTKIYVQNSRPRSLAVNFEPRFLRLELEKSLRRLNIESIPIMMLHSPPASVLQSGEAITVLERAFESGLIQSIGVSVDDITAAEASLADTRISVIQIPFHEGNEVMASWLYRASGMGKLVVVREIYNGIKNIKSENIPSFIENQIKRAKMANPNGVTLIGTINPDHLDMAVKANFKNI